MWGQLGSCTGPGAVHHLQHPQCIHPVHIQHAATYPLCAQLVDQVSCVHCAVLCHAAAAAVSEPNCRTTQQPAQSPCSELAKTQVLCTCAAGCTSSRVFCPYLSTSPCQRGSSALSCCSCTFSNTRVLRATGAWLRGSADAEAAHASTPGRVSCSRNLRATWSAGQRCPLH
jgi:hypothetical protein